MTSDKKTLREELEGQLADQLVSVEERLGETTIVVRAADMLEVLMQLRDAEELKFAQMSDLAGMDYSAYADEEW